MDPNNEMIIDEIIEAASRLYKRDLLAAADGNISYRISDNEVVITESGVSKGFLKRNNFSKVTLDGKVLEGKPSTEMIMHLEIFKNCPKAKCIIHAHPPTTIAWTIAYPELQELNNSCMSEVILAMGKIPIVPFAKPGTKEMADVLNPYLPRQQIFVLARHGALAFGETVQEALNGIERVEHVSKILLMANQLKEVTNLDKGSLDYLWKKREEIGDKLL